jgi:hypothetical protein
VLLGGGAVPAGSRRRESAEDARLDSGKLSAGSILLQSRPKRRIGGGHGVGSEGLAAQRAAGCRKAAEGRRARTQGEVAGVLRGCGRERSCRARHGRLAAC